MGVATWIRRLSPVAFALDVGVSATFAFSLARMLSGDSCVLLVGRLGIKLDRDVIAPVQCDMVG